MPAKIKATPPPSPSMPSSEAPAPAPSKPAESNAAAQAALPPPSAASETPHLDAGGGSLIGSASAETQLTFEADGEGGLYTQALLDWQKEHPGSTIQDAMRAVADPGGVEMGRQAEFSEAGDVAAGSGGGRRLGVFVGNADYEHFADLPGALTDAAAMSSAQAASYPGKVDSNLDASGIRRAIEEPVAQLGKGDEMMFFYSGHGVAEGLVGVGSDESGSDVLGNSVVSRAAATARAKGAQFTAVIDACQSGGAVEDAREQRAGELAATAESPEQQTLLDVLREIEKVRDEVVGTGADTDAAVAEDAAALPSPGEDVSGRGSVRVRLYGGAQRAPGDQYAALEAQVARYEGITKSDDLRKALRLDAAGWSDAIRSTREDVASSMARVVLERAGA